MEPKRVIIIGNSGSGKTWLGEALSRKINISLYHMDNIRWDQRGYEIPRSATDIEKDLQELIKQDSWILEGVFGKMARYCLPFSNLLIWLDIPWEECKQNLLLRGPQFEGLLRPTEQEKALAKLIEWALEHYSRNDANSWEFFNILYSQYNNRKINLKNREEISSFLHKNQKT